MKVRVRFLLIGLTSALPGAAAQSQLGACTFERQATDKVAEERWTAFVEAHFALPNPEQQAVATLLRGHELSRRRESARAQAFFDCGLVLLERAVGEPPRFGVSGEQLMSAVPHAVSPDLWLDQDLSARLFDERTGALVVEVPQRRSLEKPTLDEPRVPYWEPSFDGPRWVSEEGERLFPHPSNVQSNGEPSVRAHPSPDGTRMVSAGSGDVERGAPEMAVRSFDVTTGTLLWERVLPRLSLVNAVAWSPRQERIAIVGVEHSTSVTSGDTGWITVVRADDGRILWTVRGDERYRVVPGGGPIPIGDVAWLNDGNQFVASQGQSLRFFDVNRRAKGRRIPLASPPSSVTVKLSSDERWALVTTWPAGGVSLVALDGSQEVALAEGPVQSTFSPWGDGAVALGFGAAKVVSGLREGSVVLHTPQLTFESLPIDAGAALYEGKLRAHSFESGPERTFEAQVLAPLSESPSQAKERYRVSRVGARWKVEAPGQAARTLDVPEASAKLDCAQIGHNLRCLESWKNGRRTLGYYVLETGKRTGELDLGTSTSAQIWGDLEGELLVLLLPSEALRKTTLRVFDLSRRALILEQQLPAHLSVEDSTNIRFAPNRRGLHVVEHSRLVYLDLDDPRASRQWLIGVPGPVLIAASLLGDEALVHPIEGASPVEHGQLPLCVVGAYRFPWEVCRARLTKESHTPVTVLPHNLRTL